MLKLKSGMLPTLRDRRRHVRLAAQPITLAKNIDHFGNKPPAPPVFRACTTGYVPQEIDMDRHRNETGVDKVSRRHRLERMSRASVLRTPPPRRRR
ncbi:hypothetical protein EOD23_02665 [Mesorhizobium sp. USDA-HM6]|nr:hypothetical protein EOD23_02665 [Mesorhizobium sp. USDA-HM6]